MSLPETPLGGLHKGQGRDADGHRPQARPCSVLALWLGASVSWTPRKGGPGYLNYFTSGAPPLPTQRRRRGRPLKSEAFVSILSGEEALAAAGSNISSISPCRAAKGPKGQTQALAMPLGMRTRAGAVPHLSHWCHTTLIPRTALGGWRARCSTGPPMRDRGRAQHMRRK